MGVLGIVGCHLFKYFWPKRKVLDTNVISGSEASKDSASIAEINKENEDKLDQATAQALAYWLANAVGTDVENVIINEQSQYFLLPERGEIFNL